MKLQKNKSLAVVGLALTMMVGQSASALAFDRTPGASVVQFAQNMRASGSERQTRLPGRVPARQGFAIQTRANGPFQTFGPGQELNVAGICVEVDCPPQMPGDTTCWRCKE
ncbi:hypothetical protein RDV64_03400 [Acuticoccus sp. MNP-M23]|uniref:hypothetical protein n=1 Tax=Acuticoccus sp. MNP-M23 TaxID=3072793 RepID=UPI002814EE09|nr:hypothetical protein [Acuticoccus sp. MNP-M23]WMS43460.1 hypothetical protein RDV64_03400 [Acuticoccus sp. MNP-M23]